MSAQYHSGGTPLAGKIVWVTGAGSGVGEAAAVLMARAGVSVVLTGRRIEPLEAVAARIAADGGISLRLHPWLRRSLRDMAAWIFWSIMRE